MSRPRSPVANIGLSGRRARRIGGVLSALLGLAMLVVLVATGAPRAWRLALFFPFLGGAFGVLQAKEKT